MSEKKVLITGLPEAGKTTFIAAFWHYISSFPQDKSIRVDNTADSEHEYLNAISEKWLQWAEFGRTISVSGISQIKMKIVDTHSQQKIVLNVPDIKGEVFRDNFNTRTWSRDFDSMATDLDGLILFLNPQENNLAPKLIVHEHQLRDVFEGQDQKAELASEIIKTEDWSPNFTCIQVKVVENLQLLKYYKIPGKKIRVSIVISAWDSVIDKLPTEMKIIPEQWVEDFTPLLYQYLKCNSETFDLKYFGVSAQGCGFENKSKIKELSKLSPIERILVQESSTVDKDITKPILWAIQ